MFIHCCPLIYAILQGGCCRNFIYRCQKCCLVAFRGVGGPRGVTPVSQQSARPTVGRVIRARRVAEPTVRRGHRTVQCANGSESPTVGFAKEGKKSAPDNVRWCTGLSGAPATEGKNCLPGMLSTTPSCLGAIKGTPRRMEEYTKHSLSIPKHQDFNSAHSILCDSN
jgi:hypothetical protein